MSIPPELSWYIIDGWRPHPQDARYFYKGTEVRLESELQTMSEAERDLVSRRARVIPERLYGVSFTAIRGGVDCPHCERYLKVNRKRLNHTMMQYLLYLYSHRNEADGWVQASRVRIQAATVEVDEGEVTDQKDKDTVQTGDYKILAVWGLVELHPQRNGFARITRHGVEFVCGRATVRESVFLENYKNKFVAFDGPEVNAQQANRTSFTLAELDRPPADNK